MTPACQSADSTVSFRSDFGLNRMSDFGVHRREADRHKATQNSHSLPTERPDSAEAVIELGCWYNWPMLAGATKSDDETVRCSSGS